MDAREAENLVKVHGGIRAAAKATGVPYATLNGRLKGVQDVGN
jgi:molybdenum-dependent DNA-binding transcriptional regulator ModE